MTTLLYRLQVFSGAIKWSFAVTFLFLALAAGSAAAQLSIMPLGDSITKGGGAGLPTNQSGYRDQLYTDLTNENISFKFTGVASTSSYSSQQLINAGDQNSNGFGSYTLGNLYQNLAGSQTVSNGDNNEGGYWLTGGGGTGRSAVYPNVVLLMGGTNDIQYNLGVAQTETNMTNILHWFATNRPNTIMLVGDIIPYYDSNTSNAAKDATYNSQIQQFNSWLSATLPSYGSNFHLVDTYDTFVTSTGAINSSLYTTSIHPNLTGYADLGNVWNTAIEADVVPEPASFAMIAAGLLVLLGFRHRLFAVQIK